MNNVEKSAKVVSYKTFVYKSCLVHIDKFGEEPVQSIGQGFRDDLEVSIKKANWPVGRAFF